MKKTLLSMAIAFISAFAVNAQQTWNFSDFTAATFTETTIVSGLKIMAASSTNVSIDANNKVNGSYSFTQRLKLGGSGAATNYMPTTRALVFNVTGPGDISVASLSSSSSTDRRLILTNGTDSLTSFTSPGSYTDANSNTIPLTTYQYTGAAATLYLYSVSSGVNIYLLAATSATPISSLKAVLSDKGVSFNGTEILNNKGLSIEVYSVLGKRIANSTKSLSTTNFQKGVYVVRVAGTNDALKIKI
ncbi:MAG: T9SS type A sorting domain-containing protein [Paludibacter sp.]